MSDKIERIIDALRKKILEEAIRGNLVPQNPADEPASTLLERIAAERERLIREKKIKKPKSVSRIFRRDGHFYESINGGEPTCIDDDIPFDIPESWEWVRLSNLGEIVGGGTPSTSVPAYWDGGIPWITPADMRNNRGKYISRGSKDISELGVAKSSTRILPTGSVVFSSRAPIGYVAITENDLFTNQGFKSVSFFMKGNPDFIYYALIGLTEEIKQRATGTTFAEISGSEFGKTLIPLPPRGESSRIVKVIESYYSVLEKIQNSRIQYKRILSATPTSLRQQLIQAAIQGQLVPQNPNDEPASKLLERIAAERAEKHGKKAAKSMSRIERRGSKTYELFPDGTEKDVSEEIPFDIPDSWEWSRLNNLVLIYTGKRDANFGSPEGKYHFFTCAKEPIKSKTYSYDCEAILLAGNGDIGNITYYKGKFEAYQRTYILENSSNLDFYYLYYHFLSNWLEYNLSQMYGSTIPYIRLGNLQNYLVAVPPLEEQHRIVEKLGALLKLV